MYFTSYDDANVFAKLSIELIRKYQHKIHRLSVLNDKYTEEGNFASAIDFLSEIIFNPDVKDDAFNKEKLEIVKSTAKSALNSIKEDASNYSLIRMAEIFGEGEPISYRMMGYLEDLDKITGKSLYDFY